MARDPGSDVAVGQPSSARPGNVDTVLVGGSVRKWRGRLVGPDLATVRGLVDASREHLLAARAAA